jgi:hypothetical protein
VPGPHWSDDDPADQARIAANCAGVLATVRDAAHQRRVPSAADARAWHAALYAGCTVPPPAYVGNFRGDGVYPELVDYEVGVGPKLSDGYPERVGVWAAELSDALDQFFSALHQALAVLDGVVPPGTRPGEVDVLHEVVALVAVVHGEWVRMHPFANGNGRTARLWAAHLSLRYGLPVFVTLTPRPHDVAYARAAKKSMGRPPDFVGDHTEAVAVFAHLLNLTLLGG